MEGTGGVPSPRQPGPRQPLAELSLEPFLAQASAGDSEPSEEPMAAAAAAATAAAATAAVAGSATGAASAGAAVEGAEAPEAQDFCHVVQAPSGSLGLSFSPVIRCGTRAIGARVTAVLGSEGEGGEDPKENCPLRGLVAEGDVLEGIDGTATTHLSFDRIMCLLRAASQRPRTLRFRDVRAAWQHSANRSSPRRQVGQPHARAG